jgi:hypothetical protein
VKSEAQSPAPVPSDLRGVVGLLALAALAAAFLVPPRRLSRAPCPFKALTGLPCPTCGMTRAAHAALHLRWREALRLSPLGAVCAAAMVPVSLVWIARSLAGRARRARVRPVSRRLLFGAGAALLAGNWAAVIWLHAAFGVP